MITSLKPKGRAAIVLPHGVLFRGGKEAAIRKCILDKDQVEAVIGLAKNLFYATSIEVCVLVLRKSKPDDRKRKVMFIDASKRFQPGKNRNTLGEDDVKAIHAAYHEGKDIDGEDGLSLRMVDLDEIKAKDYDLNIGRYVSTTTAEDETTVEDTVAAWKSARAAREKAEASLLARLIEAGFGGDDHA